MKISSLIPDLTDEVFGSDLAINKIMLRMAERIDYQEAIIKAQKEDIAEREEILDMIRRKSEISDDSVFMGSVLKWDPDYRKIRDYFGGGE